MLVAKTALRAPGGVGSNTRACWSPGRDEYKGSTINSAASVPRPFKLKQQVTYDAGPNTFHSIPTNREGHRGTVQNNKLRQPHQAGRRNSKKAAMAYKNKLSPSSSLGSSNCGASVAKALLNNNH